MEEQEREGFREPEEADVEGHWYAKGRGEAEAPEGQGERSEESENAEVEAHGYFKGRGDAEAPEAAGERSEESDEPGGERDYFRNG